MCCFQLNRTFYRSLVNCTHSVRRVFCIAVKGCKNRICSIAWSEVIKGVPNQGLDFCVS